MSCQWTRDRLDAWIDGELTAEDAEAVRAHCDACDGCGQLAADLRRIVTDAARLPREVEPAHDLWPGIADGLEQSKVVGGSFGSAGSPLRRVVPWLAAAAVVILAVALAYRFGQSNGRSLVAAATPTPANLAPVTYGPIVSDVASELRDVRDALMIQLEERRHTLDPMTLQVIDDNLKIIDDAIARITTALGEDPGNPTLSRQLVFAYRQQIDLLRRAAEAPREL